MVLVPTQKIVMAPDPNTRPVKFRKVQVNSFMVAIVKKGGKDWTFIDGSSLQAADLRRVFPFLPKDEKKLKFPPRGGKEIGN